MKKCTFTSILKRLLFIILSLSLVCTSLPATSLGRFLLAPPGGSEHLQSMLTAFEIKHLEEKAKEDLINELRGFLSITLSGSIITKISDELLIKIALIALEDISNAKKASKLISLVGSYGIGKKNALDVLKILRQAIIRGRITPFLVAAGMPEGYEMFWHSQRSDFWTGEKARDVIKMGIINALHNIFRKYHIDPDNAGRMVDIGGRTGWLEQHLGDDWSQAITLFDINEHYLSQAKKRGVGRDHISGNVYQLSEYIKDIDVVISFDAFDTFLDLDKACSQCYEALNPGGIMIIAQFSPPQIEPLIKELQTKGLFFSPVCLKFFDSKEKQKDVEEVYRKYKIIPDGDFEEQRNMIYRTFLDLRDKLAFDENDYYHKKLVRALKASKFEILEEGTVNGYYKGARNARHANLDIELNRIYSSRGNGVSSHNPSLTPGIIEEEVDLNVVVVRKPETGLKVDVGSVKTGVKHTLNSK